MTHAIRPKRHTGIARSLRGQGVDMIDPSQMERASYSALFEFGGDLSTLLAQGNMTAARENASAFAQAVFGRLMAEEIAA